MLSHFHHFKIALLLTLIQLLAVASSIQAQDVFIDITGNGSDALYIERGKDVQEPVDVTIGQTVRWTNNSRRRTHTATATDDNGAVIFDTEEISRRGGEFDIEMTQEHFDKAGGEEGETVEIEYVCDLHPDDMKSVIRLSQAEDDDEGTDDGQAEDVGTAIRRDITTLSDAELTKYRDAWRAIQNNGAFQTFAGFHGCPLGFCHRDSNTFLGWHREYLLKVENALREVDPDVALHYWDWTAADAQTNGIPAAFTAATYTSGGSEFSNPLRRFTFSCPPGAPRQTTSRRPRQPFMLRSAVNGVRNSYRARTFNSFDGQIEGPHGSIHVWIGGNMGGVRTAAYDPIFWHHHSNVDRQWASWQEAGGAGPSPQNAALPLRGFPGRTVGDTVDFKALGFEYDRYDQIATPQFALQTIETGQDGKSKTFTVDVPGATKESLTVDGSGTELVVKGIPLHPSESYYIHVFMDQPDASLDDVKEDNEKYVGSFGIFGHEREEMESMNHMETKDRSVLDLSSKLAGIESLDGGGSQTKLTFIAVDKDGQVVDFGNVPINAVQIGKSETGAEAGFAMESMQAAKGETQTFIGLSKNESFDEAYRDAASQAQGAFGPDRKVNLKVLNITGERGTIVGLRNLRVEVEATVE